jgi:hypothetical protein
LIGSLLGLEEQDGTVSEVEVNEVFGLCINCGRLAVGLVTWKTDRYIPWVTKLPKFLPTMQCHVAPLRVSN